MNRLINWLQNTGIGRVLTAFAAAILLLVSTACNSPDVLAKTSDQVREEVPNTGLNSRYEGGMNDYSDVDPRVDTKATKAEAKALSDKTKRNAINMNDDVSKNTQRTLDKKSENLDQFNRNVKESAEGVKDKTQNSAQDFAEGAKRGTENIKENLQNAGKGLPEKGKQTAGRNSDLIRDNGNRSADSLRRASDRAADAID